MHPAIKEILIFAVKLLIFVFFFLFASVVLLQSSGQFINLIKTSVSEKSRVTILGFVQNPVALEKASTLSEKANLIDRAILEMELAIGLLELHSASPALLAKYTARLKQLQSKKEQQESESQDSSSMLINKSLVSSTGKAVKPWKE